MVNRGKRSIALDMRSAEGLAIVKRLVRDADVFTQNWRPVRKRAPPPACVGAPTAAPACLAVPPAVPPALPPACRICLPRLSTPDRSQIRERDDAAISRALLAY